MSIIDAVIFDLDGTLVDSEPNYMLANREILTPYGVPVVKKCFWLNQSYLAGEIEKLES